MRKYIAVAVFLILISIAVLVALRLSSRRATIPRDNEVAGDQTKVLGKEDLSSHQQSEIKTVVNDALASAAHEQHLRIRANCRFDFERILLDNVDALLRRPNLKESLTSHAGLVSIHVFVPQRYEAADFLVTTGDEFLLTYSRTRCDIAEPLAVLSNTEFTSQGTRTLSRRLTFMSGKWIEIGDCQR